MDKFEFTEKLSALHYGIRQLNYEIMSGISPEKRQEIQRLRELQRQLRATIAVQTTKQEFDSLYGRYQRSIKDLGPENAFYEVLARVLAESDKR